MLLVRRFTLVCSLIAMSGVSLAALVQHTSRPARSWEVNQVAPCVFHNGLRCLPPLRR
jgi:hypothetical protein